MPFSLGGTQNFYTKYHNSLKYDQSLTNIWKTKNSNKLPSSKAHLFLKLHVLKEVSSTLRTLLKGAMILQWQQSFLRTANTHPRDIMRIGGGVICKTVTQFGRISQNWLFFFLIWDFLEESHLEYLEANTKLGWLQGGRMMFMETVNSQRHPILRSVASVVLPLSHYFSAWELKVCENCPPAISSTGSSAFLS